MNLQFKNIFNQSILAFKQNQSKLLILSILIVLINVLITLLSQQPGYNKYMVDLVRIESNTWTAVGPFILSTLLGIITLPLSLLLLVESVKSFDQYRTVLAKDRVNYINLFGAYIIYSIIVGLGLVFLIIPGIYLMVRLLPYLQLVIVEGINPIQALGRSFDLTEGKEVEIFKNGFRINMMVLFGIIIYLLVVLIISSVIGYTNELLSSSVLNLLLLVPTIVVGLMPVATLIELTSKEIEV